MADPSVQTLLVPQGAEYQAVQRGLRRAAGKIPVLALPMGMPAVSKFLTERSLTGSILLLGLGGSLTPDLGVGDRLLTRRCVTFSQGKPGEDYRCDRALGAWLASRTTLQTGDLVTSDRVITAAAEKRAIGQRFAAQVVDMEGAAVLHSLQPQGCAVAILRVISDDCHHDLPDMTGIINADGSLNPFALARTFGKNPRPATRLVRGSLRGLKVLETTVYEIFSNREG